jgi:hypothetical protein
MRSVPTSFCVSRFRRNTQLALMVSLVWSIIPEVAARIKWADISPEDLAATESKSSPGSDSEILFSRHLLDNSPSSTWTENHVQAKIYTPKGVELASIFNINYSKDYRVTNIAARLVKPDGRSSELTKQDFRETTLYKQGGYEFKRVSFAFPNLQPGDVIEYSWTEAIVDSFLSRYDFFCQAEVPTREYLLEVEGSRTDFDVMWFNCKPEKRDPKSHRIVFKNLPPFVEEPLMPPETEFRGWITILFSHPWKSSRRSFPRPSIPSSRSSFPTSARRTAPRSCCAPAFERDTAACPSSEVEFPLACCVRKRDSLRRSHRFDCPSTRSWARSFSAASAAGTVSPGVLLPS